MPILTAYHECFGTVPVVRNLPENLSLAEMIEKMPLPEDFGIHGHICINGWEAPRFAWPDIKPKPCMKSGVKNYVTFHYPPRGGGGGDGKNVVSLVAAVALTAGTAAIAGGFLATSGGLFTAGSLSATALAAGVSLAGALLVGALSSAPSRNFGVSDELLNSELGKSAAEGNIVSVNGNIPRVVGTRKVYPYFASEPLTEYSGQNEVTEAVFCLAGPHLLENIKIGSAAIEDIDGIEYETRPGWPGDARLSLVGRQSKTKVLQSEFTGTIVKEDNGAQLDTEFSGSVSAALPKTHTLYIGKDADEHQAQLIFQGLNKQASTTDYLRIPFRIRIREAGEETWIDLPEIHYQAASLRSLRATIKLLFEDGSSLTPAASSTEGFVEARIAAPGQTSAPATDAFAADSSFDNSGAGQDYLTSSNTGSTNIQNVVMDRYTAAIYLDPATFPKGVAYEVEIKRGNTFRAANYVTADYEYSSSVWDLFGYRGEDTYTIVEDRSTLNDTFYIVRSVSIWNEHPVPVGSDLALIAVRATNRVVNDLSVEASGYVKDWTGSAWTNWTTTSNPAPHLMDIYTGHLNIDAVPVSRVDNDMMVNFRSFCAANGYECNALIEEQSVAAAAQIVAACGYGRPYQSEVFGVIWDYDRSSESPVQVFNERNIRDFSWEMAFPAVPDGFLVNFYSADEDYEKRQVSVLRTGVQDGRRLEQASYEGLVTESEVVNRAQFDLRQADHRNVFYTFTAGMNQISCRRGSLIGVNHSIITSFGGAGRIERLVYDGSGDIVSVILDMTAETYAEDDMLNVADMLAVADMLEVGAATGIVIAKNDGSFTDALAISNGGSGTNRFDLATPLSATNIEEGLMVTVGTIGTVYDRMIVMGVDPRDDWSAVLTCVDEAPELFT